MSKKFKLDIFKVLGEIDNGNFNFIETLTEEELKSFSPYVIQTWIYGSYENKELRTILTNEFVNQILFQLQKHPKLLYKLFCVSSGFGGTRHYFPKTNNSNKFPQTTKLIMNNYNISNKEAIDMLRLYTKDSIKEVVELNGLQKEDEKKVMKEWD